MLLTNSYGYKVNNLSSTTTTNGGDVGDDCQINTTKRDVNIGDNNNNYNNNNNNDNNDNNRRSSMMNRLIQYNDYIKYYYQFTQSNIHCNDSSNKSSNVSSSRSIDYMGRQGIAEIESFHNLNLTSKVEVSILVIIEKLHKAKLNTILKLSLLHLNYNRNSNENNNHNTIKEEVINYKLNYKIINSYIQNTISYALHDFPLNPIFLSSYILTNIHSTLGYLNIRSYFKNIHLYRKCWNGGLQIIECIYSLHSEYLRLCYLQCNNNDSIHHHDINSNQALATSGAYKNSINEQLYINGSSIYHNHHIIGLTTTTTSTTTTTATSTIVCVYLDIDISYSKLWCHEYYQRYINIIESLLNTIEYNCIAYLWKW